MVKGSQSEYHDRTGKPGGVAERLKAPVLKTGIPLNGERGFESHPLRHLRPTCPGSSRSPFREEGH